MESNSVPEQAPKTNRNLIIGIVIAVVLCCCVVIIAAVAIFSLNGGKGISLPSYGGIADAELRTDTMKLLGQQESADGCENISLASAQVMSPPQTAGGAWIENWQISACGESHLYAITFTPDPAGGTNIQAQRADQ